MVKRQYYGLAMPHKMLWFNSSSPTTQNTFKTRSTGNAMYRYTTTTKSSSDMRYTSLHLLPRPTLKFFFSDSAAMLRRYSRDSYLESSSKKFNDLRQSVSSYCRPHVLFSQGEKLLFSFVPRIVLSMISSLEQLH